jgi:hypothetical protein
MKSLFSTLLFLLALSAALYVAAPLWICPPVALAIGATTFAAIAAPLFS